jgi:uncharacterized membrane protein YdjX (TVP38/TMEM64 family)
MRLGLALTRRQSSAAVVVALLMGAALLARTQLELRWELDALRAFVTGLGFWGPVALVGIIAFRPVLLVPSQLALIAGGICFGTLPGTAYGALGLSASGVMVFGLTRWLGAEAVRTRVPAALQRALAAAGSRWGAVLVAVGNGYPVGTVTAYHAAAALTPMRLAVFTLAVGVGSLLRAWTYAFFGNAMLERSTAELVASAAAVAAAALLLPLLHPRARAFARARWRALSGRARSAPNPP